MSTEYFAAVSPANRAFAFLPKDAYFRAAALLIGGSLAYTAFLAIYRLVLSPVAGFPGPKIAAMTGWHEFYYDFFLKGKFLFEIEKMHDRYGEQRLFDSWTWSVVKEQALKSECICERSDCENQPV